MTSNLFNEFIDAGPEAKLESIESKLIVGNTLVGSRLLLRQILTGWGARAAIALAPIKQWLEALRLTYNAPIPSGLETTEDIATTLQTWAASFHYQPEDLLPGSRGEENYHNPIRSYIGHSLWQIAETLGGQSFSRDFVMRLGNNGFTPDILLFLGPPRNTLREYYLEGPAEIAIEILRPGHEYADRIIKRDYYAAGGVPEYIILNPARKETEFWRLINGKYERMAPDASGCYRPQSVPGLVFVPDNLWREDEDWYSWPHDPPIVYIEGTQPEGRRLRAVENGLGWGCLPFNPQLQLEPVPISFEQYIAWCPEAKFEFWDGKPQIGSKEGIRNLIGMLLMTFGLADALKVLPPVEWVTALLETETLSLQDAQRKAAWWDLARQAAALLRSKYGVTRLGVIGDLVKPEPLNFWSEITLVVWDLPDRKDYEIYQDLSKLSKEPDINLIEADSKYATVAQQQAISQFLVEI